MRLCRFMLPPGATRIRLEDPGPKAPEPRERCSARLGPPAHFEDRRAAKDKSAVTRRSPRSDEVGGVSIPGVARSVPCVAGTQREVRTTAP